MNKEDLIIGIHGDGGFTGGHYNVIAGFSTGLLRGFQNCGVKAYSTKECYEKRLLPNLTIGFNVSGFEAWEEYLKRNIINIMWNVDSIFFQNIEAVKQFQANPNFFLFNISPSDTEALQEYFPLLKHAYVPHAVDLELWKKKDLEKEYDIVFLSSIFDWEAKIEELRESLPKQTFELLMIMFETWMNTPNISFWQMYQIFKQEANLVLDVDQYNFMFKNLSYLVSFAKRAQVIEKLQNFNVKIFGSGPWHKYTKGKVQYMGECDLLESVDVMNKAKIVLHVHPSQLTLGLHERILNASAVESFVMSSDTASIQSEFGDSMGYFNLTNFDDIEEKMAYFLNNPFEMEQKAQIAKEITEQKHTWTKRAEAILEIIK
ncbi:MAG TPA: glycosyltransferase [Candidatus Gastranaerophilaceae bacterium]|nr:glycosyltransferase [Candidatus Gastranaerophilaceae bacterium]